MKYSKVLIVAISLSFKASNLWSSAARSAAFIVSPPSQHLRTNNKPLFAYTDGELGRASNINIDKSKSGNISSIRSRNLPPTILPNGGRITMVGSGPGDPDLLTMAAHKLLSDPSLLVVTDRLVSPEILELINGEIKVARKLPGCADKAQEEVSAVKMLVDRKKYSIYYFSLYFILYVIISN